MNQFEQDSMCELESRQVQMKGCPRHWISTVNQNRVCRFVCMRRTTMIQSAIDSPDPGEHFRYSKHYHNTHKKFLGASKVKNFIKKQQK